MSPSPVSTRDVRLISRALLLALAPTTLAVSPKPAWADDQGAFKGTLTVQFTGSTTCAKGDGRCASCTQNSGLYIEAQGVADTTLGPLFAKVLKCAYPPNPNNRQYPYGTYAGTMTLSGTPPVTLPSLNPAPKDILTLVYLGHNDDGGDFYGFQPFSGTLTVQSGAGKFQRAQGAIAFIAQSGPAFATSGASFGFTGNAFYSLQGRIGQGEQSQ